MSNQYEQKWREKNPGAFTSLMEMQEGRCAICEDVLVNPNCDHDHLTGEVRGLLCQQCNCALGLFQEDVWILESALRYLKRNHAQRDSMSPTSTPVRYIK